MLASILENDQRIMPRVYFAPDAGARVFFEVEDLEAGTNVSLKGRKLTRYTPRSAAMVKSIFMGRSIWSRTTASRHFCGDCVSMRYNISEVKLISCECGVLRTSWPHE